MTFTLLGLLIIILIGIPLFSNIKKQFEVNDEKNKLEEEIAKLEGKNTELEGLIGYLNSDEFIEEQAKLNLNYKKEGESVVIIKDEDVQIKKTEETSNSIYNIKGLEEANRKKETPNYKKWLNYFFN